MAKPAVAACVGQQSCDGHNWGMWQLVVMREQTQRAESKLRGADQPMEVVLLTDIKTSVISARCCSRCGERETK